MKHLDGLIILLLFLTGITSGCRTGSPPELEPVLHPPGTNYLRVHPNPAKVLEFVWSEYRDADSLFLLEDPDGQSGYQQIAVIDPGANRYELRVPIYKRINARYILQACNPVGCTDTEPAYLSGELSEAIGSIYVDSSLNASSALRDFGRAIAFSDNGNTLVIGAPGESSETAGINSIPEINTHRYFSGAVYVFEWQEGEWLQQAYIKASDAKENGAFGYRVALSSDGNTLAVSGILAPVYIFKKKQGSWYEETKIEESGIAMAISGDGKTLVFGDKPTNVNDEAIRSVLIYSQIENKWEKHGHIYSEELKPGDHFGKTLSLSKDGSTLAVMAEQFGTVETTSSDDLTPSTYFTSSIYIFSHQTETWQQQARLQPANISNEDELGYSLALSANGDTLAVGAPGEDSSARGINSIAHESSDESGAVYVFIRTANVWQQEAYIKSFNSDAGDRFGEAVSISNDGNTLAVGAIGEATGKNTISPVPDESMPNAGAVYTLTKDNGNWNVQVMLKPRNNWKEFKFGSTVALSGDGDTLAARVIDSYVYLY